MSALNLSDSKIIHRQQIVQLLQMAIEQHWQFSYVSLIRNHVESKPIGLVSVHPSDGTFAVDRNVERSDKNPDEAIMFRAQSGGISVAFKSRLASSASDNTGRAAAYIELPYEVRCTQLRKSIRISADSLAEDIPVQLYMAMGVKMDGLLADISVSGAQFRVKGDHAAKFRSLQTLEACKISLPEDFVLRCDAQLMGVDYVPQENITLLHCQFVNLPQTDDQRLDAMINATLQDADSSLVVINT
ncbi:MAG: hypothetical protein PsegKO_22260 [Pseudohongiellaceae bacterium]|jgi:c-di-GMP-binding flagellar brake protein YcgR